MRLVAQRLAAMETITGFRVALHRPDPGSGIEPPHGVWRAADSCYRFLAAHCPPGTRTLETGLGLSTLMFATWQCTHTCVVPWRDEAEKLSDALRQLNVDISTLRLEIGRSEQVLPRLPAAPLDLVFIDGGHGFPTPVIDWFYAGGRLVEGGVLVLDDVNLPSVSLGLRAFLDADPRWTPMRAERTWCAWRRNSSGPLADEWSNQVFLPGSPVLR